MPFGIGATKPHHYLEMLRTVWENRRDLPYAWRILSRGVCDGCALGVSGFRDWTIDGIHLCTTRLSLLKINTSESIEDGLLGDAGALPRRASDLRRLGRLAHPLHRRRGERGFRRVSWDEALDIAAAHIQRTTPDRIAFYLTARGLTNETYYVAQKVARYLGTNNIDNAARICHAPSTVALKRTLGVAATTCSYRDVLETDLVVIFGSDVANAQPVFMKYLYQARKTGTKVAVVNPLKEPGLENYWVPSSPESAVFGTRMTDEFVPVHMDDDAGRRAGNDAGAFGMGNLRLSYVANMLRGWAGDDAEIRELHVEYRSRHQKGDILTATGTVVAIESAGGEGLVTIAVDVVTQDGRSTAPGTAVLAFPLASGG